MTTLTEMVAAVVVQSSAFAFAHFGVALDAPQLEQRAIPASESSAPASERVVARSHRKVERLSTCPEQQRARERAAAIKA